MSSLIWADDHTSRRANSVWLGPEPPPTAAEKETTHSTINSESRSPYGLATESIIRDQRRAAGSRRAATSSQPWQLPALDVSATRWWVVGGSMI